MSAGGSYQYGKIEITRKQAACLICLSFLGYFIFLPVSNQYADVIKGPISSDALATIIFFKLVFSFIL